MKRIFAILLSLIMLVALLPASAVVSASSTVTVKPFYTITSKDLWEPEEYVVTKPFFFNNTVKEGQLPSVSSYGTSDIKKLAQKLKEDFDNRPEGTRYINLNLLSKSVHQLVEHNVYYDKAVVVTRDWINAFFSEYKSIGGLLDGIALDVEYFFGGSWYIHLAYHDSNKESRYNDTNIFRNIVEDPRYLTDLRPMLEEYGFEFYPESKQTEKKSEIFSLDTRYSVAYNVWNTVNTLRMTEVIEEAVYKPLIQYYPDALVTDYQVRYTKGWLKTVNSTSSPIVSNLPGCGTTSNYSVYSVRPNNDVYSGNYTTPASCYYAAYEQTAFNTCRWELNMVRDMYEANPYHRIAVHMTYFNYTPKKVGTYSNTPYYAENYFHVAMLDPEPLMSYIIESEVFNNGQDFDDPNIEDYGYSIKVVNSIMAEMTRVAGASDREPIFIPSNWSSSFILSGMYAGGRNIWRITPDTSTGVSVEEFKIKDKAPTFYINGQTITFPQGRIIEDGEILQVGTCGYWVETPADVMPVITNDADRFAEYPSLLETFEQYEAGSSFKTAAMPADCWEVSGNATVETSNGDKALALTGTATIKSVKLPKNITAGDSYAKQQAWEVTVTAPEAGELKLLAYASNDMAVKIADGKVYYANNGKYEELAGVEIKAGETYTIKREFDFRTENAFTASYTVYDAAGKKLGSADDVAMAKITLPVEMVGFYSLNVSGTAYLDDFKMYPTGVTTELQAFNVKTGYQLDGLTSEKDAGYRLSWMNASADYKIAKIYNNGKLVEEIKMAPGQNGVATGVVEGSNIKLSVVTEDDTAPAATNYDNGNFNWTAVAKTLGLATGAYVEGDAENPEGTTPTGPSGEVDTTTPGGSDATNPGQSNSGNNKPGTSDKDTDADGNGLIIVVVLAAVLLVVLGGVACVLVFKPKKPTSDKEQ